jgi:hypothetical protein
MQAEWPSRAPGNEPDTSGVDQRCDRVSKQNNISQTWGEKKIVFGLSLVKIRTHDQLKVLRLIGEFKGFMGIFVQKLLSKNFF